MQNTTDIIEVLVVDDDNDICDLLVDYLTDFGMHAVAVGDGVAMRDALARQRFDIIILDRMLPGEDGLSLCRSIRFLSDIPIIMLTALGESVDKVDGLEVGADDYVIKPFDPRELLARLHTILRRSKVSGRRQTPAAVAPESNEIRFGGWTLNRATRELTSPALLRIPLSHGEFRLLSAFIAEPQCVLSRSHLLSAALGRSMEAFDRTIDLMVSRLRQKLDTDPSAEPLLRTIRGEGYIFDVRPGA
jgi:two-component system OmpR family response regulator